MQRKYLFDTNKHIWMDTQDGMQHVFLRHVHIDNKLQTLCSREFRRTQVYLGRCFEPCLDCVDRLLKDETA